MPHPVQMLRSTLRNPFIQNRVDTAWDARSLHSDVRSINDKAFQHVLRTIREVRDTQQSHALLLAGEPGSGKTHLLNRVRRWIQEDERSWFVYILPITAPDRVFRDILQATAADVTRSAPEMHGINQLAVSVARLFMADVTAPIREIAAWWQLVVAEHPEGDALAHFLIEKLDLFLLPLRLDTAVVRVIAQFLAGRHRAAARDWLLGRSIAEETLAQLGVTFNLDDEAAALNALSTLVRLGADFCTVVFAFDQIEGLQLDPDDRAGLMAFAHGATQLLAMHPNVAIVTCAQVHFVETLEEIIGLALFQRIGERQSSLKLLTPAEATELVEQRLRTDSDIEQVRVYEKAGVGDPVWPLTTSQIELLSLPSVSARKLLIGCREMFDAWQEEGAIDSAERIAATSTDATPATLEDVWDAALDEEQERPSLIIDDGVIIDGLIRAAESDAVRAERGTKKLKDVDLVLHRGSDSIAVAVCNAENMTSLASRLKRIAELHAEGRFHELVIVRDQRLPIKASARATQQRLRELATAGARVVRLSSESYAALAALRRLLADAAAGDLTLNGRAVQPDELKTWLAQHAPATIVEAVRAIAGAPIDTPRQQERASHIQELLEGRWLAALDTIANEAKLPLDELRDLAARESAIFGVIHDAGGGTHDILFLRSSAVRRA